MKKPVLGALAALAATALLVTGCASGSPGSGQPSDPSKGGPVVDDLKFGTFLDITNWDPAGAEYGFDGPFLSAVYDPLVRLSEEGEPTPALAEKWEWNDDRTVLTMHLRDGVEFSDGAEWNADAAVANIQHLMDGTTSSEDYTSVKAVSKVDDDTIELTLKQRDDNLLYMMGIGRSWMASPKAIEADTLSKEPVGSGPYTLDLGKSTPGSDYYFDKVADYWNPELFPFESVEIRPYLDAKARQNAFDGGQTNLTYGQENDIARMKTQGKTVTQRVGQWIGLQFVDRTGSIVPAMADARVRKAITLAFDGEAIMNAIAEGQGSPTNQVFRADGVINDTALAAKTKQDIAKAKELMAEAGYADGFTVTMPMAPAFTPWQAITTEGLKEIGITVKWDDLQQMDYQKNASNYAMFNIVMILDSSPQATVMHQISKNQWWNGQAEAAVESVPEVAKLIDTVHTTTGDEQLDAIRELNEKVTELAWFDVWYQGDNIFFSEPGITITPIAGMMVPTLNMIQQG